MQEKERSETKFRIFLFRSGLAGAALPVGPPHRGMLRMIPQNTRMELFSTYKQEFNLYFMYLKRKPIYLKKKKCCADLRPLLSQASVRLCLPWTRVIMRTAITATSHRKLVRGRAIAKTDGRVIFCE